MMSPVALSLLTTSLHGEDRAKALAIYVHRRRRGGRAVRRAADQRPGLALGVVRQRPGGHRHRVRGTPVYGLTRAPGVGWGCARTNGEFAAVAVLILPFGLHSNLLLLLAADRGLSACMAGPDPSVFGHAVSNGCVRLPAAALHLLSGIPLGTLVLITR
jgi:hypothetical protein